MSRVTGGTKKPISKPIKTTMNGGKKPGGKKS
jgi:hypothetical protein